MIIRLEVFKNPQDHGKIDAVFGQIFRFLVRIELERYALNLCLIDSLVRISFFVSTEPGNPLHYTERFRSIG